MFVHAYLMNYSMDSNEFDFIIGTVIRPEQDLGYI